jgi:hypothetical protein
MLESINVRFFCFEVTEDGIEEVEIEHPEFVDLYAIAECLKPRLDIVKHSVFANGCRQLCITLWAERETGEPV